MDPIQHLVEVAIEVRRRPDHDRLLRALDSRAAQGSSVDAAVDRESGQVVLRGAGEDEVGAEVEALRAVHGIDIAAGPPQVAYRETLTRRVERSEFIRRHPEGQTAGVRFVFAPEPRGAGNAFVRDIPEGGVVEPRHRSGGRHRDWPIATSALDDYMPGIADGIAAVMGAGVLGGYPLVDVRAVLTGATVDDVESSIAAFAEVTRMAFREALLSAGPILLEPVMAVEIAAPSHRAEAVQDALEARRALVRHRGARGDRVLVEADVPLASMLGAAAWLRTVAPGAALEMRFARFAPVVPRDGGAPPPGAAAVRV